MNAITDLEDQTKRSSVRAHFGFRGDFLAQAIS